MELRARVTMAALVLLLAGVAVAALLLGQAHLSDPGLRDTLLELRAVRVGAAALAGAALAVGGAVLQGVFRNPLVSPDILGTTAGATLTGQLALFALAVVLPGRAHQGVGVAADMVLPLGCLAGAGLALAALLAFARDRTSPLGLLLTGFILSSLFLSLSAFVTSLAQNSWEVGRAMVAFSLGGVGGVSRRQLLLATPLVAAGTAALWGWGRSLDVLLSGEEEASTLGVAVGPARRWIIVWVAVLTAAAVSVGGNVGFVGLVVPHALRPLIGVQHRRLIPAAALLGASFLVACDVLARTIPARTELPLGVVTGIIGAPVFLVMLRRWQEELRHG
jgi:iron complex transport system permease protein